jgi:hypothetical protein
MWKIAFFIRTAPESRSRKAEEFGMEAVEQAEQPKPENKAEEGFEPDIIAFCCEH